MRFPRFALRIALTYAAVGCVWIVATDWLVGRFAPPDQVATLQTLKGWVFVGLSALLLFELTRRHLAERDREEARVRALREELDTAQELAGVAHWTLDPEEESIHWSGTVHRIFGVEADELGADRDALLRYTHDDDRARVRDAIDEALGAGRSVDLTHRVRRPSGEVRWVRTRLLRAHNGQRGRVELIGTLQDVTEPTVAEQRLRASEAQLKALSAHLQEAREEERRRISMDIHDQVGGTLAGLRLTLGRVLEEPDDPETVRALAERIDDRLQETLSTVRTLARQIRPGILDELGIGAAVEWLAQDLDGGGEAGLEVELDLQGEDRIDLPSDRTIHLFRVAQEALTNVVRHAGAEHLVVTLHGGDGEVVLRVEDDGCGFRPDEEPPGMGQLNMRERAALLGGDLDIRSGPGAGTRVELRVPQHRPGTVEAS